MELDAADLSRRLGGRLVLPDGVDAGDVVLDGLSIDSRTLQAGQLFAALRADRDGHEFVDAAVDAGAAAVLVEELPDPGPRVPSIVVADVRSALAVIARTARERLSDGSGAERVVGITGSVGKTTTKDLLAGVARRRFETVASERSFNNELGVPLTLANAPEDTEVAVIEMGARGRGHIRHLCDLARPTVGVVTVVEAVHTEVMGTVDQIAVAKRELVESLPDTGAAVLNAGDPNVIAMAGHTDASIVTFGCMPATSPPSGRIELDVTAEDVRLDDELRASFLLRSAWGDAQVRLGVRGAHNVGNALAAAAAGLWLGVPPEVVADGLTEPPASPWRMELTRVEGGPTVLNDAYNAGPASMAAALEALASLPVTGRRVAVLGVMAELGRDGPAAHRRIAAMAERLGVAVVAVDCELYGAQPSVELTGGGVEEVVRVLGPLGVDDAVLVKGSRVAGLERVAAALTRRGP